MINFETDPCCNHEMDTTSENVNNNSACEQELVSCKEQLAKANEKYVYLNADFDNFRRNMAKERAQWTRSAQTKIFEDLVGVIDDFSLAVLDFQKQAAIEGTHLSEIERARFQGIELVYKNFLKFLELHGITEISTVGAFNPHMHEALVQIPAEGKESGAIIDVFQKGYMHKDTVLRPAKVSVAQ